MRLHVFPPSYLGGVAALSRFYALSSPYGPMCTMMELGGEEAQRGMSSASSSGGSSAGGATTPRSSPSPVRCTQASPELEANECRPDMDIEDEEEDIDEDEISVGCPSPRPSSTCDEVTSAAAITRASSMHSSCSSDDATTDDDYFKPLKKLKMMQLEQERMQAAHQLESPPPPPVIAPAIPTASSTRSAAGVKSFSILDILSHRPVRKPSVELPTRIVRPWDLGSPPAATMAHSRRRPQSADSSSGRSGAESEDCGDSPAPPGSTPSSATSSGHHHHHRGRAAGGSGSNNTSPLDALFQMTSKTFEGLNGNGEAEGQSSHLNLFNSRQQPKKKRKSRTAFTNHQIFELEKRFLYQKYLSPADRDEIAQQLGLSNAQVITWFQNRRAKLKRDMEELKKDVESAKILTAHKSFLENVQDLGLLKKKVEECKTAAAAAAAVAAAAAAAVAEK